MNNQGRMLVGWVYDPNHADIMAEQAESARVEVRLQRHPPIAAGRLVLSESRAWELQFNRSVHLESNVWIGVGSQIMSNLTIGVPGGVVREIRDHNHNHGFYEALAGVAVFHEDANGTVHGSVDSSRFGGFLMGDQRGLEIAGIHKSEWNDYPHSTKPCTGLVKHVTIFASGVMTLAN